MEIRSFFTYKSRPPRLDIEQKSMTIPGQAQSVADLIARFTAGVPMPEKQPLYFGDRLPIEVTGQPYDFFDVMSDKQQLDIDYKRMSAEFEATVKEEQDKLLQAKSEASAEVINGSTD